jgi:hypothetical protein
MIEGWLRGASGRRLGKVMKMIKVIVKMRGWGLTCCHHGEHGEHGEE